MLAVWGSPQQRKEGAVDDGVVQFWEVYQPTSTLPHRTLSIGHFPLPTQSISSMRNPGGESAVPLFPSENFAFRRKDLTGLHLRCLTETVSSWRRTGLHYCTPWRNIYQTSLPYNHRSLSVSIATLSQEKSEYLVSDTAVCQIPFPHFLSTYNTWTLSSRLLGEFLKLKCPFTLYPPAVKHRVQQVLYPLLTQGDLWYLYCHD